MDVFDPHPILNPPTKLTAPLTLLHHQAKEVPFGESWIFCWCLLLEWLIIDLYMGLVLFASRWTPTSYKQGYTCPYKWVTGAIKSLPSGVTTLLVTGLLAPPCNSW